MRPLQRFNDFKTIKNKMKSNFIKAKINAYTPQFKDVINLKPSSKTSLLLDFVTETQPKGVKIASGDSCNLYGKKHYIFRIYESGILRTDIEASKKLFYPFFLFTSKLKTL